MQLVRRESSLGQLESENKELQDQLTAISSEVQMVSRNMYICILKYVCPEMCVLQVKVMQVARTALQDEFDQLVSELEESQSSVAGLEGQVRQEGEKREGGLTRCADVIRDLQQQLEAAEERWNTTKLEVYTGITS